MKVLLSANSFDPYEGIGTSRYAYELASGLREAGLEVESFSTWSPKVRGGFRLSSELTKFFSSVKVADIYHATDPAFTVHKRGRTVVTFHDLMHRNEPRSRVLYKTAVRDADRIIAVSTQTADDLKQLEPDCNYKLAIISEGISDNFRILPEVKRHEYLVGYVGDLNPRKRVDLLLRAFALVLKQVPEARLEIIGKPIASFNRSYEQSLVETATDLDLNGKVRFLGFVSEEELVKRYNEMRLLVLPSKEEGFGFPILEAARCGTPSIVMADGRIPYEVAEYSARAGSVEELASLIADSLPSGWNIPLMREIIKWTETFTWHKCVEETRAVYESL